MRILLSLSFVLEEYFHRRPGGVNPVQLNDVVFALHAVAATLFTIFQCFIIKVKMDSIWENLRSDRSKWANWLYFSFSFSLIQWDKQRVSYLAIVILIVLWALMLISLFASIGKKLQWLDLLYIVSYVKLAVTLIKYVPQVSLIASFASILLWDF